MSKMSDFGPGKTYLKENQEFIPYSCNDMCVGQFFFLTRGQSKLRSTKNFFFLHFKHIRPVLYKHMVMIRDGLLTLESFRPMTKAMRNQISQYKLMSVHMTSFMNMNDG